jgi:4-aminobutyrate aminotransferase-like enzyme/Ser/Thr protein kinase RdoA (MazF antagonist)
MQPDTLLPDRTSTQTAARLAAELFGISGTALRLPGEYDDNFQIRAAPGEHFVLKIMHHARTRELIDLQVRALQHVAGRVPQLQLPRVLRSRTDAYIEAVTDAEGSTRYVWMLTYIVGRPLVEARPHTQELFAGLGEFMGRLDEALSDFSHPAAQRELKWDLSRASWIRDHLAYIADPARRALVARFMERYESEVVPALPGLRTSVIHGDANDHNVITEVSRAELPAVAGLIDFGDLHHGVTVSEVAIAAAYALLDQPDPLTSAARVVAGYHRTFPLSEIEISLLYSLIATRLCVSVTNSALRKTSAPDDPYITISERPAWAALEKLAAIPPGLARCTFRVACGLPGVPRRELIMDWLRTNAESFAPVMAGLDTAIVFDLSVGSTWTGADPQALETPLLSAKITEEMRAAAASIGVGRYDEARSWYAAASFCRSDSPAEERRTIHLGIDLFAPAGTQVSAPLAGSVHAFANNASAQDYGPVIVLRHETHDGTPFFTLYGHLSLDSLERLSVGQPIARGQRVCAIGAADVNGGWPPHLHFQLIIDPLDLGTDFPGVAYDSARDVWRSLSPDPNVILRIARDRFPSQALTSSETLAARRARLGSNLSVSYRKPLKIVRGWKQHLYDDTGRAYLDAYNNVPLVGHSHPRVVRAAQAQLGLLNTNTRYLHDNAVRYAERLTALMPAPLQVCYFLNSASEANELAIRMARTYTHHHDIIVLEHAYHGHTNTLIDISPYKFTGPGGAGRKPWVHVAPIPDDYRGAYRRGDPDAGPKYAAHVARLIADGAVSPAAFIAETLPSVGGQIVLPRSYLPQVYASVRAAGGVCIADEVQVGFGRLGECFWGFESQGVIPDIVVLGKPIGNTFPLAAVVTTAPIAAAFDNGMEFFSTFGGNPVACAAGLAVLDVLREEQLPQNALRVGNHLRGRLAALMDRHALVGDVRGMGLFLGVELVRDRTSLEPADAEASYVTNRLRELGILTGTDGPYRNVIKIRPPLCFTEDDADFFADTLDAVLAEDGLIAGLDPKVR